MQATGNLVALAVLFAVCAAMDTNVTVLEDSFRNVILLNDTDVSSWSIKTLPGLGWLHYNVSTSLILVESSDLPVSLSPDSELYFTPKAGFYGEDSFEFDIFGVNPADDSSGFAYVSILRVNDPPAVIGTSSDGICEFLGFNSSSISIILSECISDIETDMSDLQIVFQTIPTSGVIANVSSTLTVVADSTRMLTYAPDPGVRGNSFDTFNVLVFDGYTFTSLDVILSNNLTILPECHDGIITILEDSVVIFSLSTFVSLNGAAIDTFAYYVNTSSTLGSLYQYSISNNLALLIGDSVTSFVSDSDSLVVYVPSKDSDLTDSFLFNVSDFTGTSCAVATITFNIASVDDPPVAENSAFYFQEDSDTVIVDLSLNVTDIDTLLPDMVFQVNEILHNNTNDIELYDGTSLISEFPYNISETLRIVLPDNLSGEGVLIFSYLAYDLTSVSNLATFSLSLAASNDAPVLSADPGDNNSTCLEDTLCFLVFQASDIDSSSLFTSLLVGPSHGVIYDVDSESHNVVYSTLSYPYNSSNMVLAYLPTTDYSGLDSFTFEVFDVDGASSGVGLYHITVMGNTDTPSGKCETVYVSEDVDKSFSCTITDGDAGDMLIVELVSNPSLGTLFGADERVVTAGDILFTYSPDTDAFGTDSLVLSVTDQVGLTSNFSVLIVISEVNDPPVVSDVFLEVIEDRSILIDLQASNVDSQFETWTAVIESFPSNGTLYQLNSSTGAIGNAVSIGGIVFHGQDTEYGEEYCHYVVYVPYQNYHGHDSFIFSGFDSLNDHSFNSASVFITIVAENDPPVLFNNPFVASLDEDSSFSLCLSEIIVDPDIGASMDLISVSLTNTLSGVLTSNTDGTEFTSRSEPFALSLYDCFTYSPPLNQFGSPLESLSLTISDSIDSSLNQTIDFNVTSVNDLPVLQNSTVYLLEGETVLIDILSHDPDSVEARFTGAIIKGPEHGKLYQLNPTYGIPGDEIVDPPVDVIDGASSIEYHRVFYVPDVDYTGLDQVIYNVYDEFGAYALDDSIIFLEIENVNDPPVAVGSIEYATEDVLQTITLQGSDAESSLDDLFFFIYQLPRNGTIYLDETMTTTAVTDTLFSVGTRTVYWNPPPDAYSADLNTVFTTFEFGVSDGEFNSTALVDIVLNPGNDAPIISDEEFTIAEDSGYLAITIEGIIDSDNEVEDFIGFVGQPEFGSIFGRLAPPALTETAMVLPSISFAEDELESLITAGGAALQFYYYPKADWNSGNPPLVKDTFNVAVSDGIQRSETVTYSITVTPVNDRPVPQSLTLHGEEDIDLEFVLTSTDVENDPLNVTIESLPRAGTLFLYSIEGTLVPAQVHDTFNSSDQLLFRPELNGNGIEYDSFLYSLSDTDPSLSNGTITFDIEPVDDYPVVIAAYLDDSLAEDTTGFLYLSSEYVYDIEEDELDLYFTELPDPDSEGVLYAASLAVSSAVVTEIVQNEPVSTFSSIGDNGYLYTLRHLRFIPVKDFFGTVMFSLYAQENRSSLAISSTEEFSFTILNTNDPPVATDSETNVIEGHTDVIELVYYDVDDSISELFATIESFPPAEMGFLTLPDGTLASPGNNMVPFSGFESTLFVNFTSLMGNLGDGSDADLFRTSFSYSITDESGATSSPLATMTLVVSLENYAPIIVPESFEVTEDEIIYITFTIEDYKVEESEILFYYTDLFNGTLNYYLGDTDGFGEQIDVDASSCKTTFFSIEELDELSFNPDCAISLGADNEFGIVYSANTEIANDYSYIEIYIQATDNAAVPLSSVGTYTINLKSFNDLPELDTDFVSESFDFTSRDDLTTVTEVSFTFSASDIDSDNCCAWRFPVLPVKGTLETSTGQPIFMESQIVRGGSESITVVYHHEFMGGGSPYISFEYVAIDSDGGESMAGTAVISIECPLGYVVNSWKSGTICEGCGTLCLECPDGGICDDTGMYLPYSQAGYWLSDTLDDPATWFTFTACTPAAACSEGVPALSGPGGFYESDSGYSLDSSYMVLLDDVQACTAGFTGTRCGDCAPGYYSKDGLCPVCAETPWYVYLIIVMGISGSLGALAYVTKRDIDVTSFRILINFLQLVSYFSDFDLDWSPEILNLFSSLSFLQLNLDLFSLECSITGITYYDKWAATLAVPLVLLSLFLFIYACARVYFRIYLFVSVWRNENDLMSEVFENEAWVRYRTSTGKIGDLLIKSYLQFATLIYLILVFTLAELFDCTYQESTGISTLDAQTSLECYTPEWKYYQTLAILGIIIYGFGIPFSFYAILFWKRPPLKEGTQNVYLESRGCFKNLGKYSGDTGIVAWNSKYSALAKSYTPKYFYWELVIIFRKLMVSLIQLVATGFPVFHATFVLLVMIIYSIVHYQLHPIYFTIENDRLEYASNLASCFVLICGILLTGDDLSVSLKTALSYVCILLVGITGFMTLYKFIFALGRVVQKLKQSNAFRRALELKRVNPHDIAANVEDYTFRNSISVYGSTRRSTQYTQFD